MLVYKQYTTVYWLKYVIYIGMTD